MWLYRLRRPDLPVYTHDGLIRLTEAFIQNQEDNREHLIATGYRNKVLWEKFPWLEDRLGTLYPTKPYSSVTPTMENPGELTYSWATTGTNGQLEPCSYEDVPIYDVLIDEDVEFIGELRSRLFNLRLLVLKSLLGVLREKQTHDQGKNITQIILDGVQPQSTYQVNLD